MVLLALLVSSTTCRRTEKISSYPDSFAGVGLELTIKDGYPTVVRALEGGPGQEAGVRPGDRIVEIEGRSTEDMGLGDAVVLLRGEAGSQVSLAVARDKTRIILVVRRRKMTKGASDYAPTPGERSGLR